MSTPTAPRAATAGISASSTTVCVEPENANNGWKSVGTQQAVITADLRESKTFNRVDLYPAAGEMGPVSAGQGMPKDFTIEVSQDGKSWAVVYTAADKTMENGRGLFHHV